VRKVGGSISSQVRSDTEKYTVVSLVISVSWHIKTWFGSGPVQQLMI